MVTLTQKGEAQATGWFIRVMVGVALAVASVMAEGAPRVGPLLPESVMVQVDRGLGALAMTRADVRFDKNIGEPRWALGWITNTLVAVWPLAEVAEDLDAVALVGEAAAWWGAAERWMELAPVEEPPVVWWPGPADPLEAAIDRFRQQVERAMGWCEQAFRRVAASDRVYLATAVLAGELETEDDVAARELLAAAGLPRAVQERVEAEGRALDGTATALAWLALAGEVDLAALRQSGMLVQRAAAELAEAVAEHRDWPAAVLVRDTELGRLVIGTTGADVFEGEAWLVLDPGGDDRYGEGPGAANGLTGPGVAVVVDLGGDDVYDADGLLGAGSALWGLAVVLDRAGDDVVQGALLGAGSALAGAAWYENGAGDDRYRHGVMAQGAGQVGFGFLIDRDGNDVYEVGTCGQAYAGVMGWGLLVDEAGHDRYLAGNRKKDHERNDDRFLSLAQGFAIGWRPHAGGGVAALIDRAGNDTYVADIYGQGVSYYYAAGFLLDGGGHDTYSVYQYGQGCGIHLSLGLLADAAGDDRYDGYILAQGAAHDFAVGMLFDHDGNDTYTTDHHAQGRALNNAFALLVDRVGDDAYFARQRDEAQGIGNSGGHRDYGSLALLVDLAGEDRYSGGFSNGVITLRPLYGAVVDHHERDEVAE